MSINPKWVAKILNGEKTLEIRKTMPKCDFPIDVYIYCTKDKKYANLINSGGFLTGMVVAKFTLNSAEKIKYHFGYYDMGEWTESYILENSCLTSEELDNYFQASKEYNEKKPSRVYGYGWNIDNLEIFNEPKPLSHFLIPSHKVQGIDRDGSDKTFTILKPLDRAPQSWCFVEI